MGYIAQRVPLIELLRLQHPLTIATTAKKTKGRRTGDFELDLDEPNLARLNLKTPPPVKSTDEIYDTWTPWDVCDGECYWKNICSRISNLLSGIFVNTLMQGMFVRIHTLFMCCGGITCIGCQG